MALVYPKKMCQCCSPPMVLRAGLVFTRPWKEEVPPRGALAKPRPLGQGTWLLLSFAELLPVPHTHQLTPVLRPLPLLFPLPGTLP